MGKPEIEVVYVGKDNSALIEAKKVALQLIQANKNLPGVPAGV